MAVSVPNYSIGSSKVSCFAKKKEKEPAFVYEPNDYSMSRSNS